VPDLLHRMIDEAAARRPEGVAVRHDGASLSYGQLAGQAWGLAHELRRAGARPRDRVAVLLGRGFGVPVAFHGVLASGAILVPIDPRSPADQVSRILRATGAKHLVTEPGRRRVVRDALAQCPDVACVLGLEREGDEPFECRPWTAATAHDGAPPDVRGIDLDPAYVLHTSGSTGLPKLILHTHRSAMSFVDWAVAEYSLSSDDRLSNHSSHHTCFATFDYYAAARVGATTVVPTPAALMMPASLAALIESERVSIWYSVPTALVQLSLRGALEERDASSLRWVLFAGETFPPKHLARIRQQLPGARFSHVYGSTETNVCTFWHLPDEPDAPRNQQCGTQLPIGRACSTSSTEVVDAALDPVPDGEEGELLVRGSTVMAGYWEEPERNRRALVRRPSVGGLEEVWFRTGDRVRVLADGQLAFVARTDLQVKVRGYRVELEEVENALLSLAMVEEAAAIAVPDGEGSSSLRAAVVVDGSGVSERELWAGLRSLLPPHAVPSDIVLLAALPRTPTGKVDRNALAALRSDSTEPVEPVPSGVRRDG
jgi:amino acid adenylation domain-containing protein